MKPFLLLIALLLMPFPAQAADCPPGVDPTYCQVAGATGGKVYSGTPEQAMQQLAADEAARAETSRQAEAARERERQMEQLRDFAPVALPFLLSLLLTFAVTRRPRRSHWFDLGYALACATAPIGIGIEYIYGFYHGGFHHGGFLQGGLSALLGLFNLTTSAVVLGAAIPAFVLSWLTKGHKASLWGWVVVSDMFLVGLVYFFVSGGMH